MKLGLGTVQFGLPYGINNTAGKPALPQILNTLQAAADAGISVLDTAADYGDSEENLGKALQGNFHFRIITKVSKHGPVRESLNRSLMRLQMSTVYGLLLHSFEQYRSNPSVWDDMRKLRDEQLVTRIGFSLYLPEELELILSLNLPIDIVQIPYSVFDRRFEKYFGILKNRGVEIHVRSVFVQGLVFSALDKLNSFFDPIRPKLEALNNIANESGKSIESLCLNFVNANHYIGIVIIGVDSKQNLERNVSALTENLSIDELFKLRSLREENEQMILPYNWKLK
jgi:aryl-alcohol dehydrogenase-like predicted oxidoreductase